MRKTIEVMGFMALGVLFWITYRAFNGPEGLPNRIPTHFDISGQPNGWGSPKMLWLLPAVGLGVYLLMTTLAMIRFARYNLPVRVTQTNVQFIHERTALMVAWIKLEMLCLFVYIQRAIIQAVTANRGRLSPAIIPVFMAVVFATMGWHLTVMIRGAKALANSPEAADYIRKD